jgi:glycosyltransferase involved in cell wall biosynthesis
MFDISLVIPTYGRQKELEDLLTSLTQQDYDLKRVEIIVVDQNDLIDLSSIIEQFAGKLILLHEKVSTKGIAYSKNYGLRMAKADLVTFPDDDCLYYTDTISSAIRELKKYPNADVVYGRIYDRKNKKNVMRNWSDKFLKLDKFNFHLNYSAITCFTRDKDLFFDERFGVGSQYGVGEELDYIMQLLKSEKTVYFVPDIDIWHPEPGVNTMSAEKTYYYALGYGATFRKNPSIPFLLVFITSCGYQLFLSFGEILRGNFKMANKRMLAFKGRISGFLKFN